MSRRDSTVRGWIPLMPEKKRCIDMPQRRFEAVLWYARARWVQRQTVSNGASVITTSTLNEWNKRVKVSYASPHSGHRWGYGIIKENATFKPWWNHLAALTFDALCLNRITPSWALPFTKHRNQERFMADTSSASRVKPELTWRVPYSL